MSIDVDFAVDKKALLAKHPCFLQLTSVELEQLSAQLEEKVFQAGQFIVKEDDMVDSVYFIATGLAEVRHIRIEDGQEDVFPIAILHPGEAIGLSETGFYSMTGKRTATVIALEPCQLWRLDLLAFYQFTQANPNVTTLMRENAELLLRMRLIKQAAPFTIINMEKQRWLAEQVTQETYSAGQFIFEKGEVGDKCYLIQEGKVEILVPRPDDTSTRLALLKPPMVFGEASFLMDYPRNTSAKAIKDTTLLVLHRKSLASVTKEENKKVDLKMQTTNPKARNKVEAFTSHTADQESRITLRDQHNANYCQVSEQGFFIWKLLDGRHSIKDITEAFHREYAINDKHKVTAFIQDLEGRGFIEK